MSSGVVSIQLFVVLAKMKRALRDFLFFICISTGITVMLESKDTTESEPNEINENPDTFSDALAQCLAKKIHGAFECVNEGSLSVLRSLNDKENLDFGEVKLARSDGEARNLLELDYDPKDFGNVVKAAARLMERRNLKWNLNNVYPGLQMRVGPMLNGNGMLEFVVDERSTVYANRQLGPGRMLMRSLVLPFLLGFKFSLASLIPLVFGVLLVITKKALFLTKIALMLSGLLGWNAFVSSSNLGGISQTIGSSFAHGFNDFGHNHQPAYDHNTVHDPIHYPYRPYRNVPISEFGYNQHVIREVVDVYDSDGDTGQDETQRNGKNFIWATRQ